MKERPIIFSSEMVKAILEKRKTQTRRAFKIELPEGSELQLLGEIEEDGKQVPGFNAFFYLPKNRWLDNDKPVGQMVKCPYGKIGDKLWVQEKWDFISDSQDGMGSQCFYKADMLKFPLDIQESNKKFMKKWGQKWKSAMSMPRKHTRINLEITKIKVEIASPVS